MPRKVVLWSLSLVIAAFAGGCSDSPTEPEGGSVDLRISLSQSTVSPSQKLDWHLVLTNGSSKTVRYDFGSGCQFNFQVHQGSELVWDDSSQQFCTFAVTSIVLQPGQTKSCTGTWDVRDSNGTALPPGEYQARGQVLTDPRMSSPSVSFRIQS